MNGESFFKRPEPAPGTVLERLAGERIDGGCADCRAFQTVAQPSPGVYVLRVHHAETCPTYRRIKGRQS